MDRLPFTNPLKGENYPFRNLLENDYSRKIVGFDPFGKFPIKNLSLKVDLTFIEAWLAL